MIRVIKNTMEYQFTEPDNHDPVDSVDFGRMCAIFEDGTGEVVFESEEIDKAEEYFNSIPKPVAKWNGEKKTYTVAFYEIEDEDGEVTVKAPFIGYRMYYQQQEPQLDESGKVVGYKDRGWASYGNLPDYMSIKDFISSTTCYLPTRKDCNVRLSLYDGDRKLIDEQMLFADDVFSNAE